MSNKLVDRIQKGRVHQNSPDPIDILSGGYRDLFPGSKEWQARAKAKQRAGEELPTYPDPSQINQENRERSIDRITKLDFIQQYRRVAEAGLYRGTRFDSTSSRYVIVGGLSFTVDEAASRVTYQGAFAIRDMGNTWLIDQLNDQAVHLSFEEFSEAVDAVIAHYKLATA